MKTFLILALLFQSLLPGSQFVTQESDFLSDVELTYQFGQSIEIHASLAGSPAIDHVTVILQTQTGANAQCQATLAAAGDLDCHIDLDSNPFSVFDRIYYWFEITYADGAITTTPSYWFDYLDNRFDWQKNESKWFVIYSTPDCRLAAEDLQKIALTGLESATRLLPISPDLPMQLYVYPDADSLRSALGVTSQDWAAGEVRPDLGVIMVSESGTEDEYADIQRQISHEIMHILEYSVAQEDYSFAPAWLLEGLAVNAENGSSQDETKLLFTAYRKDTLIPMDQLCGSFPREASQTSLAYSQSASFVTYLSNQYGNIKLLDLLKASNNQLSCDQLLTQIFDSDLATLQSDWISSSFTGERTTANPNELWLLLLLIPAVLVGLLLIKRHGRVKTVKHDNK